MLRITITFAILADETTGSGPSAAAADHEPTRNWDFVETTLNRL
jgi:hypothetical protein